MFIGDSEEGAYYYKLFDFIYYCEKKLFMSNWESLYINKKFLYSSEEEDDSGQFSPAVAFFCPATGNTHSVYHLHVRPCRPD